MDNNTKVRHHFHQHIKALTWLALILSLGQVSSVLVAGGIIADPSAAANQRPTILQTANGLPQVNIQTPSAAGVSRNTYSQFDIAPQGAILNNAHTSVQTQLGGWIQSNPSLTGGTARVILNEVNSSNPSLLHGYIEVAGDKAQVVVANPSGISCDGCGFINANRATLTTGTPIINGGNLDGYLVERGILTIQGAGLDSSQTNYTYIIARSVAVNAGIWANDLKVTTGANSVNIDQTIITPITGKGTTPTVAIDVASLGGMYAGKIHLVGTENGVGVSNAGSIGASAGEFTLTADGALINTGQIYGDHLAIEATSLDNTIDGVIASREHLDIGVSTLNNSNNAHIFSAGDLTFGGALDNNYLATGQADLVVNSGTVIEALGSVFANVIDFQNRNANLVVTQVDEAIVSASQVSPNGSSTRYDVQACTGIGGGQDSNACIGAGSFEDYTLFTMNATPSHTEVVSTIPAHISAGGDIIVNGTITNRDSSIIAGGVINVGGGGVNNLATQGQDITHYSNGASRFTWVESCGAFGGSHCREWSGVSAYNPAPKYESPYDLATITFSSNTTSTITPPINNLFTSSPDVTNQYLIETDPRFASYRDWLSSDYILTALSYDPALTQKRLGDGFYEQRLIHEQVAQLTGRRFLDGYASDEAQYQALMNNAVTVAKQWSLRPGIALSSAQVAQLTSDIVWLVERDVTLADGTRVKALVPQLYARISSGDLRSDGSLIAANTLNFKLTDDLTSSGTIAGRDVVIINAENINNLGGQIKANTLQLNAINDINNIGGTMSANDTLTLNAGNDLRIETTSHNSQSTPDNNSFSRTTVERVAGLYITNPNGLLLANAENDINLIGAEITNNGADSQTILTAQHDINLATVTTGIQESIIWDNDNHRNEGNGRDNGSTLQSQGQMTLQASNNVNANVASVNAGQLTIIAANDIQINAGNARNSFDEAHKTIRSGLLSKKTSVSRHTIDANTALASTLSADSIELRSGNNLAITGSNIVSSDDTNLSANNDITIEAAQQTFSEMQFNQTLRTGLINSGGVGFTIGSQKLATTNVQHQISNLASTIGSLEGNVNLQAGQAYRQTGSDVLALLGNIDIKARQVNIETATDQFSNEQITQFKQSGLTVAITNPIISAVQTGLHMAKAAEKTSNNRMKLLAAGSIALSANNAIDAINASQGSKIGDKENQIASTDTAGNPTSRDANAADKVGGLNVSISLGSSESSSKSNQTITKVQSSKVVAGGDIAINATGAADNSDINIIGSQIKASNNLTIKAQDQINLLAAANTDSFNSKNRSSSSNVGVSYGTDGLMLNIAASKGKGRENGQNITWTETTVQSGGPVQLKSDSDTNLKGAIISGQQVIADVGNSLNIQSLQDTSTYTSKQQAIGGSLAVGYGKVGGSVNYSKNATDSDSASVIEQSGIMAGDGGFQVHVNGNTNLTGAVIASTVKATNSLTTETLTISNVENKAEYKANAISISIGVGSQSGKPTLSGAGIGSDDGKANSTSISAISVGAINITNDNDLNKMALSRDVHVEMEPNGNPIAVNSPGNNLAATVKPIFDAEKVAKEIQAQVQITQAIGQQANRAVESYVHSTRISLQTQLKNASNDTEKVIIQSQLSDLTTEERVMNVLIGAVTGTGGAALTKEGLSLAAEKMRQITIESSKKFAGITDGITELSNLLEEKSDGVRGDGIATGGTRVDLDKLCGKTNERCTTNDDGNLQLNDEGQVQWDLVKNDNLSLAAFLESDKGKKMYGTTGGIQGWKGTLFGIPYEAKSWQDNLMESFGGTHDVIGGQMSGLYNEQGNATRDRSETVQNAQDVWSASGAIILSSPFAASELLPPAVWQAISVLLKGAQ
tara:strand:+ start:49824 stop:55391 length:5568 start_codon:yes stop_codon:yes gene_type:complete